MDVPDGAALVAGFEQVPCVVALGTHHNDATRAADVVFPVAAVTEKAGSFTDWEGRRRPFPQVFRESLILTDASVLSAIATKCCWSRRTSRSRWVRWRKAVPPLLEALTAEPARLGAGEAVLAPGTNCSTMDPCRPVSRTWPPPPDPGCAGEPGQRQRPRDLRRGPGHRHRRYRLPDAAGTGHRHAIGDRLGPP